MKTPTPKQIFMSLVVLCCFVAGLFNSASLLPGAIWGSDKGQDQTTNVSLAKASLFSPVSQHESIASGSYSSLPSLNKSQHKGFLNSFALNKFGQSNCYAHCIAWAHHARFNLSSVNIIWPFHYFW
jgi:hypothetical protein